MARKSMAEGLRKGLQREDEALDARFAVADSAMAQLKSVASTAAAESSPPVVRSPAGQKTAATRSARGGAPKSIKVETGGPIVRDSFSMPAEERAVMERLINTLRKRGRYEVTRSQLLRAGIAHLAALNPVDLERALTGVERGRPGRKVN